jgi:hypothetical protein
MMLFLNLSRMLGDNLESKEAKELPAEMGLLFV